MKSETSLSPVARLRRDKEVTPEEYTQRYRVLEAAASDRVAKCLSKQLSHTSERRQQQFTCAVVQVNIPQGAFGDIYGERYISAPAIRL